MENNIKGKRKIIDNKSKKESLNCIFNDLKVLFSELYKYEKIYTDKNIKVIILLIRIIITDKNLD